MDRREFLKAVVPATMVAHGAMRGLLHAGKTSGGESPADTYDLAVIGGSLFGCFAALRAARKGKKVLLVERRTFLATDITATLRPWLHRRGFERLQPEMKELFMPGGEQEEVGVPYSTESFGDDIPLFCGSVKKQFMAALLDAGVDVMLMTGAWGLVADAEKRAVSGVALANKFGLQIANCREVLDAGGGGDWRRPSPAVGNRRGTAGSKIGKAASTSGGERAYSLEFYRVGADVPRRIVVPESVGVAGNSVMVHKGKRMPGQVFVEFRFVPSGADAENEARLRTEALSFHLVKEHAAFKKATLVQMAWETSRAREEILSCEDVVQIRKQAESTVDALGTKPRSCHVPRFIHHGSGKVPLDACKVCAIEDDGLTGAFMTVVVDFERHLPRMCDTDVVVAGGGTAGAMAAMAAQEKGARVVTAEYFTELGGTKTLGRVTGYYWGYKKTQLYETVGDGVGREGRLLGRAARNVAMMHYFRKQATCTGGTLLTNTIVCGVLKRGKLVTGVVVEKDGRLEIVGARIVVDATGDGDVAAFAGAEWAFGNRNMHVTQNYSQWDVNPGLKAWQDSSTNRDHGILDTRQFSELQRGYQLTHQESHHYDFAPMLTVRESRRIVGEHTISLKDVIEDRHHADVICMASSDFDPHYFGDTALTRVGCLLPHGFSATVEIPYRAILPKGLDGLLVSAKAISQTHNALQFTRMSFDIMTLGYVTGWIAARQCREGTSPRDFDVRPLQAQLASMRILPESRLALPTRVDRDVRAKHVDDLSEGLPNGLIRVIAQPRDQIERLLLARLREAEKDAAKLRIARALAWFGNPGGNELLLDEMSVLREKEEASGKLPWEYYRKDKGTTYWPINQVIALLGLSGDRSVLPAILALADSLKLGNPPVRQASAYNRGRIDLALVPYYNRIINVCFAIERMPDARAIPTLVRFLDDPNIGCKVTLRPQDAGQSVYGGILESRLAATLARCGGKRGFDVLVEYLDDVHPFLARYATQELNALLPGKHGADAQSWVAIIAAQTFPLKPQPSRSNVGEW